MTNRQTRRIWWRRNGRLPACFSGRLVLFVQRLLATFLEMRLARESRCLAPLAVSILRRGYVRSADNAAMSYSYSSPD